MTVVRIWLGSYLATLRLVIKPVREGANQVTRQGVGFPSLPSLTHKTANYRSPKSDISTLPREYCERTPRPSSSRAVTRPLCATRGTI